ncbi:DUF3817 domain-containing protein [Streptacidiphilus sp. MAP5-3]|uniref:DUF3817 domain-containing protein n=1 Tax=unclassified Streptacidiphilus TaxID=2643834 RepID=UPI0035120C3A
MNKSNPLLTAYRVLAYVTGVGLVVLTLACILKYGFGTGAQLVVIAGIFHGWLYMAYVVVAFSLGNKLNWPISKIAWTVLAGTVPTAVFFVERRVVREIHAELAAKEQAELVNA